MIRILHITDFHLNKQTLRDWNNYIKDSFLKKLKELHLQKPINLITFTGDLIDIGGKDFGGAQKAFDHFNTEIILPILAEINLPIDNFLIIPGNHDIERNKDDRRDELGSASFFKESNENIQNFVENAITKKDFTGIKRIESYKVFENSLYNEKEGYSFTIIGSTYITTINNQKIGVSLLNSSWRCYGQNDINNLLVGEEQLSRSYKLIDNCDVKIAMMHHPLDWLSQIEKSTITSHIHKDYDILLIGHVHENRTSVTTGFTGTLFTNIAPSGLNDIRTDSKDNSNGFTLIDFDKRHKKIKCEYFKYSHPLKEFILNTDINGTGTFEHVIPNPINIKKTTLLQSLVTNIKEDHYKEMDNHMIGVKADKKVDSIKAGFVMPPIDLGNYSKNNENANLTLSDIIKSHENQIFFGTQESGKSTLLFRLVREYVDEYEYTRKIPVYINYDELGNKEIITCIKDYLRCSSDEAKDLIQQGQIVILFDNLNFTRNGDNHKLKNINSFFNNNEHIQLIASSNCNIAGIFPPDYLEICTIPFKHFFIRSLRVQEIKGLMQLWSPEDNEIKADQQLDRLVNSFNSFALPSNAMSVSLFLWSLENKDRKPINHAALLEIFIELILEKLSPDNVYRGKFDFTNKVQLLARIADRMLLSEGDNYSIKSSDFIAKIEEYLNDVGFDFDAQIIANYFLTRRIFIKQSDNRIRFTYTCFFHFFISKRMEYNPEFREYIMDESRYFKFHKEIDYYTALVRSDEALLTTIFTRFEAAFKPTEAMLSNIDIDKHFTNYAKEEHEPVVTKTEISTIKENRPSQELMDKFYNQRIEQIPDPTKILKKEGTISLEGILVIMSNALRNSEGVENRHLKNKIYNSIIKYSMNWMILYRESLIDYVLRNKRLPPSMPMELTLEYLMINIPFHVQLGMYHHLGTQKLAPIILDKINTDKVNQHKPDIEKFLSVALYSDIEGKEFDKYLLKFVKKIGKNVVRDYMLYKLINYYYRRTRAGSSNETMYLEIIAELKLRTLKLPQRMKERVIKSLEEGKKKFLERNILTKS